MLTDDFRRLVTLRTIKALHPIPGADKILAAEIDGWTVVVLKDEFKVGDPALYFEIDSFLPAADQRFDFLTRKSPKMFDGQLGAILKTVRLRGQISQGLALPAQAFSAEITEHKLTGKSLDEILGVVKYEKPLDISLAGEAVGNFPSFLIKTNLDRVQNLNLDQLPPGEYAVSLKMDGSSMTVYCDGSKADLIGVCSHNLEWRDTGKNAYWTVAKMASLPERLINYFEQTGRSLALQGELVGPRIQQNPHYLPQVDFYLYSILDVASSKPLTEAQVLDTLAHPAFSGKDLLPLKRVPALGTLSKEKILELGVSGLLDLATGPGYGAEKREGIVIKHVSEPMVRFKAISNEYLLTGPGAPMHNRDMFYLGKDRQVPGVEDQKWVEHSR